MQMSEFSLDSHCKIWCNKTQIADMAVRTYAIESATYRAGA